MTNANNNRALSGMLRRHQTDRCRRNNSDAARIPPPYSCGRSLMPNAHYSYGLPIGGVPAVENAIILTGVGVDIGSRMCLPVFDINPLILAGKENYFSRQLNEATLFGSGNQFNKMPLSVVTYDKLFSEIAILKPLQSKAAKQLGSSGSGNHFVEFGTVDISEKDEQLGIPTDKHLGLLSHSGSRALGETIANHYTKIAKEKRRLPAEAANLAGFGMEEEEGIEY